MVLGISCLWLVLFAIFKKLCAGLLEGREIDVGRFTTSHSPHFHWAHFGVEVGFSHSLFVAQIMLSSITRGEVWLNILVVMVFFRRVYIQFLPKGFNLIFKKRDFCFQLALFSLHGYIILHFLRVGGRLENALIEYEAKHPIILPYCNRVTYLIILQHHQQAGHLGQEYVLSSPRQLHWIIKGRSAVRHVIGDCSLCKKTRSCARRTDNG